MGIRAGKSKKKGTLKVLMLGISGSGKSTFAKQMKILHMGGFTEDEVINYRAILRLNLLTGMKELSKQVEKIDQKVNEENRKHTRYFQEKQVMELECLDFNESTIRKLESLWNDPAIKQVWNDASLYQLQIHHMDYMMEHLRRIASEDFVPTHQDILLARQRTTGASSFEFVKDKYKWQLVDVGGQIPERAKWEKIIEEGATAFIFFAGLDEFNMVSADDRTKTKMEVSLQVFEEIVHSPATEKVCALLFLNKLDLLERKLQEKSHFNAFKKNFPTYKGTADPDEVCTFLTEKFESVVPEGKEVTTHVVCAINTGMMKTVFDAVKENIFMRRMDTLFH